MIDSSSEFLEDELSSPWRYVIDNSSSGNTNSSTNSSTNSTTNSTIPPTPSGYYDCEL